MVNLTGQLGLAQLGAAQVVGGDSGTQTITGSTGIPSSFSFGTTGFITGSITGLQSIPSSFRFGVGGAVITRAFTLFIDGVDQTELLQINTLNIDDPLSQTSTASCRIQDPEGIVNPAVGQELIAYLGNLRIFGGTIDELTATAYQALPRRIYDIKASDFSNILDRRTVGAFYPTRLPANDSISFIVNDVVQTYFAADGITYDDSDGDPPILSIGDQLFNWITGRQVMNQLVNLANWDFSVDYYKVLRIFPKDTGIGVAPFNLADNDGNWLAESMAVRSYRGTYRNRQGVRSSTQTAALWGDIYTTADPGPYPFQPQPPDGIRRQFITLFGISSTPIVKKNNIVQRTISLLEIGTTPIGDWDWYWIPPQGFAASKGVFQNVANAVLISSDTLEVDYQTSLSPIIFVSCNDQIEERAAIEGNSGVYEDVQEVPGITDAVALRKYAQGLLDRYGCLNGMPTQVRYRTDRGGLFSGMLQIIDTSNPYNPPPPAAPFLITNVRINDIDGDFLRYDVVADSGLYQGNSSQFFAALVDRTQQAQPANRNVYTWPLAPSYPGITNPGYIGGGTLPQHQVVRTAGEILQYLVVQWNTPPTSSNANIELIVNTNGTGPHLMPANQTGPFVFYLPNTKLFLADDLAISFSGDVPTNAKDGSVTLVTSVSVT